MSNLALRRKQTIRLNWPQTQARRLFTDGNTLTLPWGRGGGKSWFLLFCVFWLVQKYDGKQRPTGQGVRIVVAVPVMTLGRKTIFQRFQDALNGKDPTLLFASALGGKYNKSTFRCEFPGGSWVQFLSQEQQNPGIRCDAIFADEADDLEPHFFNSILSPYLSEPHSLRLRMLTGTPRRGRYGLLYEQHALALKGHPGQHSLRYTWRAFPEQVSQAYAKAERDKAVATGRLRWFEREWEVNFDAGEGLVYPMFSPVWEDEEGNLLVGHVRPARPHQIFTEYLIGVDHGFEDPGVLLLIGVVGHGEDAQLYVLEEVYRSHQTEDWWVEQALAMVAPLPPGTPCKMYGDPSQPARMQAYANKGLTVARKGEVINDIEDGVSSVANRMATRQTFGEPIARLYVDPKCTQLIKEFANYRRVADKDDPESFTDKIVDKNNHGPDALRYAVMTRFGLPPATRHDEGAGWES